MRIALLPFCLAALAMSLAPALAQTAAAPPPPPPPPEGPISIVTYVETNPGWTRQASAALRAYRDATGKEPGATSVYLYREIRRENRFVLNEVWKDIASYEAHTKSSKLADALKEGHLAPPDTRVHTSWSVGAPVGPSATAIHGFTHIDVSPPQLAGLQDILKPYIEKTRADRGAQRFDLLQGIFPRKNHQTLAESWASEADFRAHQASAHAIEFRDKLGPLLGALYDQRFYRLVK